jgi:hypothetical protein
MVWCIVLTERHQTIKEIFEANSYQAKVDRYPFTDDYETRLDIPEALISVKLWLEQRIRENKIAVYTHEYRTHREELLKELLKEVI